MRMVALVQTGAGGDQLLEQLAPLGRQAVADTIDKLGELRRELLEMTVVDGEPSPDLGAEARLIPPARMNARPCRNDAPAVLHGRRQRPGRGDDMRIREVF